VVLKKVTGLPVTASVCGLDVTYPNRFYQSVVPRALARLDMTIPISVATEEELCARAGRRVPSTVIPLGVNPLQEPDPTAIEEFQRIARIKPGERVFLTVGRLIERKGVAWFVRHVLPELPDDVTYVVIGAGPESATIRAAASALGIAHRVRLLGPVSKELLTAAYRVADVFVMPNVPVSGDLEGFGLVALEAAASGLPVVASRLEGLTDAVRHERNGLVVTPLSVYAYTATLSELLALPREQLRALGTSFASYTREHFSWEQTARRYVDVITDVVAGECRGAGGREEARVLARAGAQR
jgi:glycosyltransferase involved in cell wall biosynthesis